MFRFLLAALLGVASAAASAQTSNDWLTGNIWVLCRSANPSPDSRDALVFRADGRGEVIRAQGNLPFQHERSGNTVALRTARSQTPVQLVASADHAMLYLRSPGGDAVASYARQGSPAMASCQLP